MSHKFSLGQTLTFGCQETPKLNKYSENLLNVFFENLYTE